AELAGASSGEPRTLLVSTVTGAPAAAGLLDAEHWWRNIRSPVRFTDGMASLVGAGFRIFVEIGPNPVLQAYLHDALRATEGEGVPVLPAAAVLEMALAAARSRRPDAVAIEAVDVELRRPLPFEKGRAREIRSVVIAEDGDWELSSRPRLADEPLTLHAVAR